MNRSVRAVLASALLLAMVGIATANDDIVYFMNNKTKKEDEIRGKIEDETSTGVKIKDKRSKDKETKLIPGTSITRIVYDSETVSVVDFRKWDGKLISARAAATPKSRAKLLAEAIEGFEDLVKKMAGNPNAKRYLKFRLAEAAVLQAQDDPTKVEAAITRLVTFKKEGAGSWQMVAALKALARLQEDAGKTDDAAKTYEELADLPDVPKDLKQESEVLVGRLLLRGRKYSDAEKRLQKLAATMSAGDAQQPFVQAYLAESQIGQNKLDGVEKKLKGVIAGSNDTRLRGVAYNLLGDYYLKKGQRGEAFWNYLRVDAMYNEDPEEQAKALYHLSSLFDQVKGDPRRGKECNTQLLSKRFAGTVYQKLAKPADKEK